MSYRFHSYRQFTGWNVRCRVCHIGKPKETIKKGICKECWDDYTRINKRVLENDEPWISPYEIGALKLVHFDL